VFFENLLRNFKSHYNLTTTPADRHTFSIKSRSILLTITNFSHKSLQKIKTHIQHHFLKIMPLYEIMWKNIVEPDRPQITK